MSKQHNPKWNCKIRIIDSRENTHGFFFIFAGLNNCNGRGTIDSIWSENTFALIAD